VEDKSAGMGNTVNSEETIDDRAKGLGFLATGI
jgi:hypothetical protein